MRSNEARKMSPESGSDPERKPRLIDKMVEESPEAKAESAGDRFAADAGEFMRLQDRAVEKALELSKLEDNPLGAKEQAKAALEKEMSSIQRSIDAVADKYGAGTEDFVADAMTMKDLDAQMAQKKARIKELNGIKETMNFPGGERGLSFELDYLTDQVVDLSSKMGEIKGGYNAKEKIGKKELASLTGAEIDSFVNGAIKENPFADLKDEEIDAALESLDQPILLTKEMQKKPEQNAEYTDAIEGAKSVDDLKIVINHMGAIAGTGGKKYESGDLMAKIDHAMVFPSLLGEITRTNGLREKVRELIKHDRENAEAKKAFEDARVREKLGPMIDEELAEGAPAAENGKKPLEAEGFDAKDEKWFAQGKEISAQHQRGEEWTMGKLPAETKDDAWQWADEMVEGSKDAPSKEEAQDLVEKNELPPEQKAAVMKDIAALKDRIKELEEGTFVYEGEHENMQVLKDSSPGIKDLEAKLREQYGLDADTLLEKKALSSVESFKIGLKGIFNRDFKRTLKAYEKKTREWSDSKQELADSEMLLSDPKAYAEKSARRLMRTMIVRANQNARNTTRPPGSPLGIRF